MRDATLVLSMLACALGACDSHRPLVGAEPGAPADAATTADGATGGDGAARYPDLGSKPKAHVLDFVLDRVLAPADKKGQQKYARDLDGDGKNDNGFASLIAAMNMAKGEAAMQKEFDAVISGGGLMLLRLHTSDLKDDANARVRAYLGKDLDGDPKDNLSGSEQLGVHPGSHPATPGKVAGGGLYFSGARFTLLFPMVKSEPLLRLELNEVRLEGRLTHGGKRIEDGVVAGVIPAVEMDGKFMPALLRQMCHWAFEPSNKLSETNFMCTSLKVDPCTLPACLTKVSTVSSTHSMLKLLMQPDLDMDNNGVKESYSIALGFSALSCSIKE